MFKPEVFHSTCHNEPVDTIFIMIIQFMCIITYYTIFVFWPISNLNGLFPWNAGNPSYYVLCERTRKIKLVTELSNYADYTCNLNR